jgi:hypothetical protein
MDVLTHAINSFQQEAEIFKKELMTAVIHLYILLWGGSWEGLISGRIVNKRGERRKSVHHSTELRIA